MPSGIAKYSNFLLINILFFHRCKQKYCTSACRRPLASSISGLVPGESAECYHQLCLIFFAFPVVFVQTARNRAHMPDNTLTYMKPQAEELYFIFICLPPSLSFWPIHAHIHTRLHPHASLYNCYYRVMFVWYAFFFFFSFHQPLVSLINFSLELNCKSHTLCSLCRERHYVQHTMHSMASVRRGGGKKRKKKKDEMSKDERKSRISSISSVLHQPYTYHMILQRLNRSTKAQTLFLHVCPGTCCYPWVAAEIHIF